MYYDTCVIYKIGKVRKRLSLNEKFTVSHGMEIKNG